jgi:hypothetical protein
MTRPNWKWWCKDTGSGLLILKWCHPGDEPDIIGPLDRNLKSITDIAIADLVMMKREISIPPSMRIWGDEELLHMITVPIVNKFPRQHRNPHFQQA